ncbi:MAG TPA: PAS domain S-box protein [Bacteroidota bacterium]|nr:PAS domain S-box protein [Bacteroidota bacterium]
MGRQKILIVEDELIQALDVQSTLERLDYAVTTIAASAQEAMDAVEKDQPDLILMDIKLEGPLDGIAAAQLIHAKYDVPIVYMSANPDIGTFERAINSNPFGYVLKPFQEGELRTAVELALYKHTSERKIHESQHRLSVILRSIDDAVIATDERGIIQFMNSVAESLTGWSEKKACGKNITDIITLRSDQNDAEAPLSFLHTEQAGYEMRNSGESLLICTNGTVKYVVYTLQPVSDEKERTTGIVLTMRDITEHRYTEEHLRTLFRAMEQSPASVVITDASTQITYVNKKYTEITGFTQAELIGRNPRIVKSGLTPPETYREMWQTVNAGNEWRGEFLNKKKNGELFWESNVISPVLDTDGKITHILAVKEDITERRRVEELIREQASLLDIANDAIIVCDLDNYIIFWNKGAERMYGWAKEEAVGSNTTSLLYAHERSSKNNEVLMATLANDQWAGEIRQQAKDKHELTVQSRWNLVRDKRGNLKSILIVNTDITEKKVLEAQFLRAQRMESLGTLAGGIAHDLNNVLAPILMSIQILKGRTSDEKMLRILTTLETSAMRGGEMVKQILVFARGMGGEQSLIDPHHLVHDVQSILKETIGKKIHVVTRTDDELWKIVGDLTQLHQVLMNLCINARDAMPNGGSLTITCENTHVDDHLARVLPNVDAGSYVLLTVSDTGVGMTHEVIEKIFDPFFTTKDLGKGTGLGLSTVHAIVKSHGGFINVVSELGRGSTFKVYFPAFAPTDDMMPAAQSGPLVKGKGECILVVDDEVAIREITKSTLSSFNYSVLTAADGTEALAIFAQHADDIDLVLTDMMMPFMDGPTTVRAIRKINPSVKVITTTGMTENFDRTMLADEPIQGFLPKPYTAVRLLEAIQQVLYGIEIEGAPHGEM